MSKIEKLICGDCNKISEFTNEKRGSRFIEVFLWVTLFFPGIFYSMWRNHFPKKICRFCKSDFLLPADSPFTSDLLKSAVQPAKKTAEETGLFKD